MSSPMYPAWLNDVRPGDVLRDANGVYRVVRSVHANKSKSSPNRGLICAVTFTIKHCSWTGRCYTMLNHNDLRFRGFQPTGIRVKLGTELDRKIAHDVTHPINPALRCCDVAGVA